MKKKTLKFIALVAMVTTVGCKKIPTFDFVTTVMNDSIITITPTIENADEVDWGVDGELISSLSSFNKTVMMLQNNTANYTRSDDNFYYYDKQVVITAIARNKKKEKRVDKVVALTTKLPKLSGHDGNPRFNLTWTNPSNEKVDLDLHVLSPSGEEIYYANATVMSGGQLDIDCIYDCPSPSENIYWPLNSTLNGNFTYWVDYYDCLNATNPPINYKLTVTKNGSIITVKNGSVGYHLESEHYIYTK